MAKESYVGISNKSKHIPDVGYVGIANKSKRLIKGYIGVNNKSKLFWEFGKVDDRFVARWVQKYIQGNTYNLTFASIEKSIKYPLIRALWLSEGVDDASHEMFTKYYKNIDEVIAKVEEAMSGTNYNIVWVIFTNDLPWDLDRTQMRVMIGYVNPNNLKSYSASRGNSGGEFKYEFRKQNDDYHVVDYYKMVTATFYSNGSVTVDTSSYSNYTDGEAYFSSASDSPYDIQGCNLGIKFIEEEGTDLVDTIDFKGAVKEFEKYVVNDFSLNCMITPSENVAYNNIQLDSNGATFTNNACFITLPAWWIYEGLFYIELEMGNVPSSAGVTSEFIFLLAFTYQIGIAYSSSRGVWGVWDMEDNVLTFRPSTISAIDYFSNKKVKIIFDKENQKVTLLTDEATTFVLPFKYSWSSYYFGANNLYLGGPRTVSSTDANCISGMVVEKINVYKNKLGPNVFQYPNPNTTDVYDLNNCDLAALLMYMMREYARIFGAVGNSENLKQMFNKEDRILNFFTTNLPESYNTFGVFITGQSQGWYRYGVQPDLIRIEVPVFGTSTVRVKFSSGVPVNALGILPTSGNPQTYDSGLDYYSITDRFGSLMYLYAVQIRTITIYPNGDYYEDINDNPSANAYLFGYLGFTTVYERSYHRYRWYGYNTSLRAFTPGIIFGNKIEEVK